MGKNRQKRKGYRKEVRKKGEGRKPRDGGRKTDQKERIIIIKRNLVRFQLKFLLIIFQNDDISYRINKQNTNNTNIKQHKKKKLLWESMLG